MKPERTPEPTARETEAPACVSCGRERPLEYCAYCGERAPAERDLTVRAFVQESLDIADSRTAHTFRTLLRRPGRLTADYVAGRRRAYLTPFQTFLIANVLFFLAAGVGLPVITLTTPLRVHEQDVYGGFTQRLASARLGAPADMTWQEVRGTPQYERLQLIFDSTARHTAATLVVIFAPLLALALALLRAGRREPAGHHVAFAFHYLAFALLLFVLASLVILGTSTVSGRGAVADSSWIPVTVLSTLAVYLAVAFRTAYRTSWAGAIVQAVIMSALFLPLVLVYRLLLMMFVLFTIN